MVSPPSSTLQYAYALFFLLDVGDATCLSTARRGCSPTTSKTDANSP